MLEPGMAPEALCFCRQSVPLPQVPQASDGFPGPAWGNLATGWPLE